MKSHQKTPVVWITGASSGIGAECVRVFAKDGYHVALSARRIDRLEALATELRQHNPEQTVLPISCDVTNDQSVTTAANTINEAFGGIDVLVNNAGFGVYGEVANTPLDVFRANMDTNYLGVIRCTQAALPLLRKRAETNVNGKYGASIVMVSSIVGRRAMPMMSSYCATKFALEGLSEALRLELKDQRIAVSVVNPGATQTEFADAATGQRPATFLSQGMESIAVAQTILDAAQRPVRNRYLTTAGKLGVLLQWLSPRLFDRILLKTLRSAKAKGMKDKAEGEKRKAENKKADA